MTTPAKMFDDWVRENPVGDEMRWADAAKRQFKKFEELGFNIGEPLSVVSTHTSKSISLPVVTFRTVGGWFLLRDNFYGVNVCALWDFPPDLDLGDLYKRLYFDDYCELVQKKRESRMSYAQWTDEEMDDPRILRVQATRSNGSAYWVSVRPEEKDRWLDRWKSTEWYGRDWSSGELIPDGPLKSDGTFGPDTVFYTAPHPLAVGISKVVGPEALAPYKPGRSQFTLDCRDYADALERMKKIMAAAPLA